MSHFQIHRLDEPGLADLHYRAFWRIDGHTFLVHVWAPIQWERFPETMRPRDARRLSRSGWMTLRPVEMGEALQGEGLDQLSEYLSPVPVSSH